MNWALFAKTFALVFLAEMGDKTQLTTMAFAANNPAARWALILGAGGALVSTTLIAVFFGGLITKWVKPWVINGAAAVLFFVFGAMLLREAIAGFRG